MQTIPEVQMITHDLSRVHGQYVITHDDAPVFVTTDVSRLFENLDGIDYRLAQKVRVLLVSSEEWDSDDITALVWEAMVQNKIGEGFALPSSWEDWKEIIGDRQNGFIELGFEGEFDAAGDRAKRVAEVDAQEKRLAKFRTPDSPVYPMAAE